MGRKEWLGDSGSDRLGDRDSVNSVAEATVRMDILVPPSTHLQVFP
jgi:hypothetical protein